LVTVNGLTSHNLYLLSHICVRIFLQLTVLTVLLLLVQNTIFRMALTPNQKKAIAEAAPAARAKMRATYEAQNKTDPWFASGKDPWSKPSAPSAARPSGNAARVDAMRRSAAPKRAGPGSARLPQIPNYLNPLTPHPVPSLISDGMALPHTSLVSDDFTVGTENTKILVVSNVGNAGTVGFLIEVNYLGWVEDIVLLTIPTVSLSDAAGGPSAGRAMKFSCSVINCTNRLKRGGRVTYLNSSQRLPKVEGTSSQWNLLAIINGIKNSPYRRRTMGDNLVTPRHLIGFPVDSSSYTRFGNWRGTLTPTEYIAHVLGASPINLVGDALPISQRPMSVVAFVFDPVSDPQDYSVTIRASFYTRWPLESVPGQSMRMIPTGPAALINAVNNHAESTANDLVHIGMGAASAAVIPRVGAWISGAARSAWGGGVAAAEGAGVELAEVGGVIAANPELALPLMAL
jgi:hypothetical protein